VKEQMAPSLEIATDQLKLVYNGSLLEDDVSLEDQGVRADTDLTAVVVMPSAVASCLRELESSDSRCRKQAVVQLGKLGEIAASAVPNLEQALDDVEVVRCEAATALGLIGEKAATAADALMRALVKDGEGEEYEGATLRARIVDATRESFVARRPFGAAILDALASIGEPAARTLAQALHDQNGGIRLHAAVALGWIGQASEIALPELEEAIGDNCRKVRLAAASSIGKVGKAAIPALGRMLSNSDQDVRDEAASALVDLGAVVMPVFEHMIHHGSSEGRVLAATSLGRIGKQARSSLEAALKSSDSMVRSAATYALGQIGDDAAMPALEMSLKDKDWDVCLAATVALGKFGAVAIPLLEQALAVDYWAVQDKIIELLESFGGAAVPMLVRMLSKDDLRVNLLVVAALGNIGREASPATCALSRLLETGAPCLRRQAAEALERLGGSAEDANAAAVSALEEALGRDDHCEDLRAAAARTLAVRSAGGFAAGAAVAALGRALVRGGPVARRLAAEALGSGVGEAAVPMLELALHECDPCVRKDAARALGAVGEAAAPAAAALAHLLEDDAQPSWVRWEAAGALGAIGGRSAGARAVALPPLTRALGDVSDWVRIEAAFSLGKFGAAAESATAALEKARECGDCELREAADDASCRIAASGQQCCVEYCRRRVAQSAVALAGA